MLITNVSEQDQCEIPAVLEPVLAVLLYVSASLMWKVKPAVGRRLNSKHHSDVKRREEKKSRIMVSNVTLKCISFHCI